MEKLQFYPLDVTYKVVDDKPVIHVYGKTNDGKQVCVIDRNFEPYFYAVLKREEDIDLFREKVKKLVIEHESGTASVVKAEPVLKKYLGQDVTAVKITTHLPADVPVIREAIKNWDMILSLHEYDIQFAKRYLLDKRIIPLTLVQAEGEFTAARSRVPVFAAVSMEQFSTDALHNPRVLAFDIETYNPAGKRFIPEQHPILMIGLYGDNFQKVFTWKQFNTELNYVEFVGGEADLIQKFKETIEHYKPDILVGYFSDGFDFPYMAERAKKYDITLDMSLDYSAAKIKKGRAEIAQLTGIVHLDVFKYISKVLGRALETDFLSLDAVASELLGDTKTKIDINSLASTWDNTPEKLEEFCIYNLQDACLTYRLCTKVMPNIIELVKIVGATLYDTTRMGFSQLVESFIMRQVQDFNELTPNKPSNYQVRERQQHTYKGAYVYEPEPGFYKGITVFDFRSLYPTIISSHNICLSTLNCECCRQQAPYAPLEQERYWFCTKQRGFISRMIEDLITRRMRIKEMLKEAKDRGERNVMLEARSESLKLLANAFYGYLGFFGARWYSIECARSVTAYGRFYINKVIEQAKNQGFKVLYADTDSIFMLLEDKMQSEALFFAERINQTLSGLMELSFEGFYPSGIFVSAKDGVLGAKKKYALLNENGNIKIRGFEMVRRNWSFIAKDAQRDVLNILLKEDDAKKALKYIKEVIRDLRERKIKNDKVVIHTQLQKETEDYAAVAPHVAVARHLKEKGVDVGPGSIIKFIVTEGKGIIRDRARIPEEVKDGEYDSDYYINNQIIPSVERIFNVLGYKKEDLIEEKAQSKLSGFM